MLPYYPRAIMPFVARQVFWLASRADCLPVLMGWTVAKGVPTIPEAHSYGYSP